MTHEGYVSRAALVAGLLWTKAAVLVGAVWVLTVMDAPMRWIMPVGLTACLAIGIATVGQIRVTLLRLCRLVRATSPPPVERAEVRSLR